MEIAFSRAAAADAALIGRLHAECWQAAYRGIVPDAYLAAFTPEKRAAFFARILPTTKNKNYILRVDGEPVGMLAFGPVDEEELPGGFAEIQALYLLPAYWGKGIGSQAMRFALARLTEEGYRGVVLWVLCDNMRARRFYQRHGFAYDGAREPITLGKELMEMRCRRLLTTGGEMLDILDPNGLPTGKTARRGDPLEDGAFYLGVHAYVYDPARGFLLQRRAMDKAFLPGGWEIHMGHVMAGEQSEEALRRELREELGLALPTDPIRLLGRIAWPENCHFIDVYWIEASVPLDALTPDPAEVIGVRYIDPREMLCKVEAMFYRPAAYRALVAEAVRSTVAAGT